MGPGTQTQVTGAVWETFLSTIKAPAHLVSREEPERCDKAFQVTQEENGLANVGLQPQHLKG